MSAKRIYAGIGTLALIGGLGACAGRGNPVSMHPITHTPHPVATVQATGSIPPGITEPIPVDVAALNYKQQYLADVVVNNHDVTIINADWKAGNPDVITSPAFVKYGKNCITTGRDLLRQAWPASARADIRSLALGFEKTGTDVSLQNAAQGSTDDGAMSAQAQIVRVDLGLPAVPASSKPAR